LSSESEDKKVDRLRTETLRWLLATPPQPHATAPPKTRRSQKKADSDGQSSSLMAGIQPHNFAGITTLDRFAPVAIKKIA
jgi:hypothetical protein